MTYSTIQGETYDEISKKVYQDEGFAGHLMNANPAHADTVIFTAGSALTIPPRPQASLVNNLPPWRQS